MDIMTWIIAGAIVGAIIAVFAFFVKKSAVQNDELVGELTEEQKGRLKATDVRFVEGKKAEWIQDGMIAKMIDKGGKYALKVLWCNKVIRNATLGEIQYADVSIKKEEAETHGLKTGDFVKLYIAPEKTVGSVRVIFD